ncbi:hypothetical protein D8M04_11965 [Oceanobacillus piezotolerans]|uniref:DUF4097 domain-containing protein n=1 Tax=Oceanobacillus piezotolerans TaxID=2448030 RepID=A0A498D4V1_9BACI|nr:DUF4097 family beta strand repeat-containing protein [Oceanobacillus piezotolerans]RLL43633.1 hypothetical protein D8M04_11965 [Oceanobacillus piezotolerans]
MKKNTVIILILLGIAALLILKQIVGIADGPKEYVTDGSNYKTVDIKSENARIEVFPATDSTARVELRDDGNQYKLEAGVNGDTLEIELKDKSWWPNFSWFFSEGPRLTVLLPEEQLERLSIDSDNGLIGVTELNPDHLEVETDNGKVELLNIETASVRADSDNGELIFSNVNGEITAESDYGAIRLTTDSLDRPVHLTTDNGPIDIRTESEPTNVTFDIRTDNGSVNVFESTNYDTVIGDGEHLIKLTTDNGSISVNK